MSSKMKTPEALTGATGAKKYKVYQRTTNVTPKRTHSAMSLYAKQGHKHTAQMLAYVPTIGTSSGWSGFVTVATAWLTEAERAALAFSALEPLPPETAADTFNSAFPKPGQSSAALNDTVAA